MGKKRALKEPRAVYAVEPVTEFGGTYSTTMTSKGQIVIPVMLRRRYGLTPQTRIVIYDDGETIRLKPVTHQAIDRLAGILAGKSLTVSLLKERALDREREDAKRIRSR